MFVLTEKFYREMKDVMGAKEFFGSLRNCEWLKLFCCAGEFYRSTQNFLDSEGFSGHAQKLF